LARSERSSAALQLDPEQIDHHRYTLERIARRRQHRLPLVKIEPGCPAMRSSHALTVLVAFLSHTLTLDHRSFNQLAFFAISRSRNLRCRILKEHLPDARPGVDFRFGGPASESFLAQ
jgi:hypothetical protein